MSSDQRYLEIAIRIPFAYQEMLIAELMDHDFDGFEQNEDHLLAYIPLERYNDVTREYIQQWIAGQAVSASYDAERVYEPQNWNEEWEKSIEPMQVGQFFIRPTWKPVPTPDGLILLEIDPKMAFGTGYHETTRSMLRMLPSSVNEGATVLDVGTGTGVLAIAALKLGASYAFGFDIDEWSYVNATENALLNDVSSQFEVKEGSFEVIPSADGYDLVLANVNRNMLLATSSQIVNQVKDGGTLLLSGLLDVDEAVILANFDYSELKLVDRLQENEWICLRFHKSN
jgi:ribosomal protein L11 methyltransferase